ncbi:hypothetical protein FQN60_008728 [Etheostoma spectabile]|uniref:Secreted protein n=1 Tax=Etheostoma spectabile TaxID=54343 RepID=A0A5J5CJ73_9PERO|nr:hypothetical protein FQN60_008728 [Etheostoma spectabile]
MRMLKMLISALITPVSVRPVSHGHKGAVGWESDITLLPVEHLHRCHRRIGWCSSFTQGRAQRKKATYGFRAVMTSLTLCWTSSGT